MQPLVVVPVDPAEGGELDVLDGLPRPWPGRAAHEFGFVVAVDGLGQSILSNESPTLPSEGTAPISARRSPQRREVNCEPASRSSGPSSGRGEGPTGPRAPRPDTAPYSVAARIARLRSALRARIERTSRCLSTRPAWAGASSPLDNDDPLVQTNQLCRDVLLRGNTWRPRAELVSRSIRSRTTTLSSLMTSGDTTPTPTIGQQSATRSRSWGSSRRPLHVLGVAALVIGFCGSPRRPPRPHTPTATDFPS